MAKDDSSLFWQEGEFLRGFNVRCYGILIQDNKCIVSEEDFNGPRLTKFPGGGLEFKEAPGDAIQREFQEELGVDVELGECFYVSPHFHRSYFRKQQLIALYWWVKYDGTVDLPKEPQPMADDPKKTQFLRWVDVSKINEVNFTHPLDLEVASLLHAMANETITS